MRAMIEEYQKNIFTAAGIWALRCYLSREIGLNTRHLEHICNHFLSVQKSNPPQIAEGSTPDYYETAVDKEANANSEIKQKDVNKPNTSKQKRSSLFKRILKRFF